jgi:hypothetical protein
MDPIGLGLENFDTTGAFRADENGAPIDASGELDGIKFSSAAELGHAIHDNPAAPACLVNRLYGYAVGRMPSKEETSWMQADLAKTFAASGYDIKALLRKLATSNEFYRVANPDRRAGAPASGKLAFQGDQP